MEELLGEIYEEFIADSILGDVFEVSGDVIADVFSSGDEFSGFINIGIDVDSVSVLADSGLEIDTTSILNGHDSVFAADIALSMQDGSVPLLAEAGLDSSADAVHILDPFSDLDGNGLRDSLQVSGLDMDGDGVSDQLQFNVDVDGNDTSDSLQFGIDLNNNGIADQYDVGVDTDGNGIFDSVQPTGFDLDKSGLKDVSTYDEVIKIKSGIPANWF